nr:adhesion G protein-coupled receptor E2-like [Parasteatoda tepidariorum]
MNICQHGDCHILNEEPGYHCDCKQGYYGDVCDKFNPCSLEPCENFGKCQNISSNKYRCECLPGFSGQNCSDFNPCAIRPSPCLHSGRCESTASHKYQCYCTKGYYGKTCQFYDPCSIDPCRNGGKCQNSSQEEYVCRCVPGYTGKQCETDIDECSSSPCKHGGTCRDLINSFHCRCAPGYKGKRCHLVEHCPPNTLHSNKGVFRWNSTSHGRAQLIECPFGSTYPDRESATGFAKRRCYLLSNGSVAWGQTDLTSCREEGFKNAEDLTGELWILTEDPKHLNIERLQVATKQIEGVLDYAIYDKKIAHNMLSIVSNLLAINESLLWIGDFNGSTTARITDLVDRFASEVNLAKGEDIVLVTENLVVRAVSWDPEINGLNGEDLTFSVHYQARKRRENESKGRYKPLPPSKTFWEEMNEEKSPSFYNDAELTIPTEALFVAQNQSYQELRIKFVAYKNDKFFREKPTARWKECYDSHNYRKRYNCFYTGTSGFSGRRVLQASVLNTTIANLSSPLMYVLPSPTNVKVFCAYWKEQERSWSTEGLITNQSGNSTTCLAFHMTSFSLLLDPTPYDGINTNHFFPLSMVSYIGCGLSMLGLLLTIITYSIFRCLNKDHQGRILIHLCISILMMNVVFIVGSQRGLIPYDIDVCAIVAVLIHYFTLSSLAWMCVEGINMYRLLIHVFASTEAHFMLKRAVIAWGIPFAIVGTTVLMDWEVYLNQNEYCMLNAENPYVYYISFLGPSCIILLINLIFFLMITKALCTLKDDSIKKTPQCPKKDKCLVTKAQIRGAFTVMVLLGVSWVFGVFAIGEARLIFQYVFSISNSLQGFLIFLVRCLMYSEARSAWYQLFKTGSFKKCQGVVPQTSWSTKSGHNKENGLTTNTRIGSTDMNDTGAFNTNAFWGEKGSLPNDIISSVREDCCNANYKNSLPTIPSDMVLDYSPSQRGSAQLLTFSNSGNTLRSYKDELSKDSTSVKSLRSVSKLEEKNGSLSAAGTPCSNYSTAKTSTISEEATKRISSEMYSTSENKCEVDVSKDIEFNSLPVEIQDKNSFDSPQRYIDERSELRDKIVATTLDRNVNSFKTSDIFVSELDKLNSWPRTLSSFAGGKDHASSSVYSKNNANQKHLQKLTDDHDHSSCQVIPLQSRPTTSTVLPSFSPSIRAAECHHFSFSVHSPASLPEKSSGHIIHHHLHQHHHVISDKHSVDMPYRIPTTYPTTPLKYHFGDNMAERKSIASVKSDDSAGLESQTHSEVVLSPDQDTLRIWEIQKHVSNDETLLEDSISSKL